MNYFGCRISDRFAFLYNNKSSNGSTICLIFYTVLGKHVDLIGLPEFFRHCNVFFFPKNFKFTDNVLQMPPMICFSKSKASFNCLSNFKLMDQLWKTFIVFDAFPQPFHTTLLYTLPSNLHFQLRMFQTVSITIYCNQNWLGNKYQIIVGTTMVFQFTVSVTKAFKFWIFLCFLIFQGNERHVLHSLPVFFCDNKMHLFFWW